MTTNPQAVRTIKLVGQTPGFTVEPQDKGRYKLSRLPVDLYDVKGASVILGSKSSDRQYQNDLTRLKHRLGWTEALYDQCEAIDREHRTKGTDPADDLDRALLTAFGVDPDKPLEDDTEEPQARPQRKRHSKGGSAAGSARKSAAAVQPAPLVSVDEAPVELLSGVGRMQAEMISPMRAIDLLANKAPYQRKIDTKKVNDYAAAMTRGEWKLNPADPLCIDTNGQTANGQHRLEACVVAEVPFPTWVAYDTPPETYAIMDRGKKRTTGDMLYGAGEANTNLLASAARFAHLWFNVPEQEQWKAQPEVTEAQVFALLEAHPNLRGSVSRGRIPGIKGVSTQASMLSHYLITRKMGGDDTLVTRWYRAIGEMDLDKGTPGHSLGLYWMRSAPSAVRRTHLQGRSKRDLDMYLLMRAWNNTCLGREMRSVGWKSDFVIPDPITPQYDANGKPKHSFPTDD